MKKPTKGEIIDTLHLYWDDDQFINEINNITYFRKAELRRNNKTKYEREHSQGDSF